MHPFKLSFLTVLSLFVVGCSHLSDGNRVSTPSSDNKSIAPLRTPPGSTLASDTLYPIPQKNYPPVTKAVDITPPNLYTNKNISNSWF